MTYRVEQLFQTAAFALRTHLHFWTTIKIEILYYSNFLTKVIREISKFYMKIFLTNTSKIHVR